MTLHVRRARRRRLLLLLAAAVTLSALGVAGAAGASVVGAGVPVSTPTLTRASTVTVSDATGLGVQQTTHVETDTASHGSTVVAAFQVGRTPAAHSFGSAGIGWATSVDDGRTWSSGVLPGLTTSSPAGSSSPYPLVVNQSVAYDAKHGQWLVPSVAYCAWNGTACLPPSPAVGSYHEVALQVSRSTDGLTWNAPVLAVPTDVDKAWGVCDNTTTSPHYGTCYVAYSQIDHADALMVVRSTDGGVTWSSPTSIAGTTGYNVFPVVRPDGTLVVVYTDVANGKDGSVLFSTASANPGTSSWTTPATIATVQLHTVPGVRAFNKPSADVDASGRLTVVWSDCRFETGCSANDLVSSTSPDAATWSAPTQLPLQPASPVDQFDPGLAVAPGTSGGTAQLSVVYYTFVDCAPATCIEPFYSTSTDGGQTWSSPYDVGQGRAPMRLSWLANAPQGRMVGDYNSVSFVDGGAVTVLPLATAPAGSVLDETEWALALPPITPVVTPPPPPPPPTPATPDTTITKHPGKSVRTHQRKKRVTFKVAATIAGSSFECRIDAKAWTGCSSKATYRVKAGRHTFSVRATSNGQTDQTPATYRFRVKRLPSRG